MLMYVKQEKFNQSPEFLASDKYVNFSTTISNSGVAADAHGYKIVKKGSIIDANGAVVNNNTAVGILFADVDVTNGPQPGALMVEGYVLEARLPVAPASDAKGAMTGIKFR